MRALHRLLVTGAFGGLAAATMASSGAFACSPTARVWVSGVGPEPDPLPAVITPGTVVDVHLADFYASGLRPEDGRVVSEVAITWLYQKNPDNTWTGESLGSVRVAERTNADGERINTVGPETVVPVTIPRVMPESGYHWMRAEIWVPGDLVPYRVAAHEVKVPTAQRTMTGEENDGTGSDEGSGPGSQPDGGLPPGGSTDTAGLPETKADTIIPNTNTSTETVADGTPPRPGPVPGSDGARRTRTFATPTALTPLDSPDRPAGFVASPTGEPAARAAAPLRDDSAGGSQAQMAANDLWSGVERGSSLVDPPTPPPGGGSSPAGGFLLGVGVLAMAGVAAVTGRRRLAALRATR